MKTLSRSGRVSGAAILTLVLVPVIVAVFLLWGKMNTLEAERWNDQAHQTMQHAIGLSSPVLNKLDPKFTDADGDLIADPPKDAAQFIDPPVLYFTYVPTDDPKEYKAVFADLIDRLSKATGKPIEYKEYTDTNEELKDLRDGKLHIAGFNTGAVPIAVALSGFVPTVVLGDEKGKSFSQSVIIVPSSSSITDVKGLKGKELALTEVGSNSGYKAPLVLLQQREGFKPSADYTFRYSGGHEQSIEGVAKGQYEAAAVASDMLAREISSGAIKPNQFREVFKSESFPSAGIGYAYNLKPELAEKIKKTLVDFNFAGTSLEKEFAGSHQTKLVPANFKEDWSLVRQIDDKIGLAYRIKE